MKYRPVEAGRSYVITRHGRPVARLLPVEPAAATEGVVEALLDERRARRLGVPVRELIDEGRPPKLLPSTTG